MSHAAARAIVETSLAKRFPGKDVSLATKQIVQATGLREGYYGAAFGGANNWGAVQPYAVTQQGPSGDHLSGRYNPWDRLEPVRRTVHGLPDRLRHPTGRLRRHAKVDDEDEGGGGCPPRGG